MVSFEFMEVVMIKTYDDNEKVVVLNSGGFDSITLMHYLHDIIGETNIYSLHFLYGALNEKEQLKCVNRVCEKLGAENKIMLLPRISWSKNTFFDDKGEFNPDSQYLEYRNLIFMSYALSYAESIGAKTIYLAFLNDVMYKDTSVQFLEGLNLISHQKEGEEITVYAPFINFNKYIVGNLALKLGVEPDEFFSCDKPVDGRPCLKCPDCEALIQIYGKKYV